MHLGNSAITPECAALTLGAAAIGVGVAMWKSRREALPEEAPKWRSAALAAALVFAAQQCNFAVSGSVSAHLLCGGIVAWLLGPATGVLVMTSVLGFQAVLLGDGGLAALGANVLNMAIVPSLLVAAARRWRHLDGNATEFAAAGIICGVSVLAAVLVLAAEIMVGRAGADLALARTLAGELLWAHLPLALVEGAAGALLVAALKWSSSREVSRRPTPAMSLSLAAGAFGLLTFTAIAWSSSAPDAYEAVVLSLADRAAFLAAAAAEIASESETGWLAMAAWLSLGGVAAAMAAALLAPRTMARFE